MANIAAWVKEAKGDLVVEEAEYYDVGEGEILIEVKTYTVSVFLL